jgi:MoxR-like ATPase
LFVEIASGKAERVVKINSNVCFFATANIGSEYSGTSSIDKALLDRFFPIELSHLSKELEKQILEKRVGCDKKSAEIIIDYFNKIRNLNAKGEIGTSLSIRHSLRVAQLVKQGLSLISAMEYGVLPMFEADDRMLVRTIFTSR